MKFGAALQRCARHNYALAMVHSTYKAAKKLIKRSRSDVQLHSFLLEEFDKWNDHHLDTEEDLVIDCADLQAASDAPDAADDGNVYELLRSLVDYHGRLILFFNSTLLAQTAVAKLIKKAKKKLGSPLLWEAQLQQMLDQAFCSTEVTSELLTTVEQLIAKHGTPLGIRCPPTLVPDNASRAYLMQLCASYGSHQHSLHGKHMPDHDGGQHDSVEACSSESCAGWAGETAQEQQAAAGQVAAVDSQQQQDKHQRQQQGWQQGTSKCAAMASSAIPEPQHAAPYLPAADRHPGPQQQVAQAAGNTLVPAQQPPAAAAPGGHCSLVEQLHSALHTWEQLRATARTPSTVFRWLLGQEQPQEPAPAASAVSAHGPSQHRSG